MCPPLERTAGPGTVTRRVPLVDTPLQPTSAAYYPAQGPNGRAGIFLWGLPRGNPPDQGAGSG